MKHVEILVIGGGPAGLCAALSAAELGSEVLLLERDGALGGQLVKQTHMFFGSEKQYASTRGFDIGKLLLEKIDQNPKIEVWRNATVVGLYEDRIVTVEHEGSYLKIVPMSIIVATGASEKNIPFPNNDLPGIYGAGAVQTLMNVYGVKPGDNVLMVGAGNIGLIVSYQLMQSGINVKAIVEGSPRIGGYLVHASKIRRLGIPIYTGYTVKEARGKNALEGATIWKLNEHWKPVPGTEIELEVDVMCIAVGLTPLSELLWQSGCGMKYLGALGGYVPFRNEDMMTSVQGIFVAGDVAGIEEASSAMVEGYLAGLSAAVHAGHRSDQIITLSAEYKAQLSALRAGPEGLRVRQSIQEMTSA